MDDWTDVFSRDNSKTGFSDSGDDESLYGPDAVSSSTRARLPASESPHGEIDVGVLEEAVRRASVSLSVDTTGHDAVGEAAQKAVRGRTRNETTSDLDGPSGRASRGLHYTLVPRVRDSDDLPPGLTRVGPGHYRIPIWKSLIVRSGIPYAYYTGYQFHLPEATAMVIKAAHNYSSDGIVVHSSCIGVDMSKRELVISFSSNHSVSYSPGNEMFDLYIVPLASERAMNAFK